MLKKDYGFDVTFNTFDKIDNKHNEFNEHQPRSDGNINKKNAMLESLKIIDNKLIDIFSTLIITAGGNFLREFISFSALCWILLEQRLCLLPTAG